MSSIEATLPDGSTIRPLSSLEEYEACAGFQEEIWGQGFSEKVPPAILMIANRLGGLTAGAFSPDGTMLAIADMITVQLWEVETGTRLQELTPDGGADLRFQHSVVPTVSRYRQLINAVKT